MIKPYMRLNTKCKDFISGAERTGVEKKEIKAICNGCNVPTYGAIRAVVKKPSDCAVYRAIIERFAVKPEPPTFVRPCDFITGKCRKYVQSLNAFSIAPNICRDCSGNNPGGKNCAIAKRFNRKCVLK